MMENNSCPKEAWIMMVIVESVVMVLLVIFWCLNQTKNNQRTTALYNFTEISQLDRSNIVAVSVMSSNLLLSLDSNVEEPLMRSLGMKSSFD